MSPCEHRGESAYHAFNGLFEYHGCAFLNVLKSLFDNLTRLVDNALSTEEQWILHYFWPARGL